MKSKIPVPLALLTALALGLLLLAGHRDEFPGRRQGGGSQSRTEVSPWAQK